MRLRVEEVAQQADVSVDTVRYYQKQRLLPAPDRDGRLAWYTDDHLERLERIKELRRRGFSLAVIRRFLSGELDPADERLAAAVVQAGDDGPEELFGFEELVTRSEVPGPVLESLVREGLLVPRLHEGEPRFTDDDVEMVTNGLRLVAAGLPLPELFDLARRHRVMTREVAERAVELFDTHVRRPLRTADLSEVERAERLVEAFRSLLPAVTSLVAHHFRRILLQVAQEHLEAVGEPTELSAVPGPERPVRAGDAGPERPVRAGDAGPERPVRAGDAGPERPVRAGDAGPERPVRAGDAGPERPVRAGDAGPES